MKSGLLTPEELEEYTGYKPPKLQFDWLVRHGVVCRRRGRDRRVVVTWEQINAAPAASSEVQRARPNLKAAYG